MKLRYIKRGFSLTEMAIVVGITGTVLAAIWVAASNVYIVYKSQRLLTDISYIATQYATTSAFGTGDFPSNDACEEYSCTGSDGLPLVPTQQCYWCSGSGDRTSVAALAGLVPRNMFYSPTVPTPLNNEFGDKFTISGYSGTQGTGPGNATSGFDYDVVLNLGLIPQAACIRILTAGAEGWMKYGLEQLAFNNYALNEWFGTDVANMKSVIYPGCTLSDPVSVQLYFVWPLGTR